MLAKTYNRIRVLPYSPVSRGAKAVAKALGGLRLKLEGSKFKPRAGDLIINWGNCKGAPFPIGEDFEADILNNPEDLACMANKLSFFENFEDKDWLPKFWTNSEEIPDEEFPIVCRTVLNGHSGQGIVIAASRSDLVPAPLYVKYIKKKDEYRVHVGSHNDSDGGTEFVIISIQQKKRRLDFENPNWQVRNHANGFIYAREDVDPPVGVLQCALDCVADSGLDFGAVDVIWNEKEAKAYVLETNSAPGLEGQTLDDYVNYFEGKVK